MEREKTCFRTVFDSSIVYPGRWNYDKVEGFQEHAAPTISEMLRRFASGESVVAHESAAVNRSTYFQDTWDAVDEIQSHQTSESSAPGNSEFSAEPENSSRDPKESSSDEILVKPGNSEIGDGDAASHVPLSES